MKKNLSSSATFADSKAHYELLDGLRGVAALLVIWYHVHEGFAFAKGGIIETFNHGYLAVDFFFMLSGFVISYAYDERLRRSMSLKDFFKRRLIRLHPMVIMSAFIGMITFCLQGSVQWNGNPVSFSNILLALLFGLLLIPALPGMPREIRGNGEMFPLNGPSWSLFFEYIGNLLYALFIQRLSNKMLAAFTLLTGGLLTAFALKDIAGYGNIGVGWSLDTVNFIGGLIRMIFPFSLGMLLSRHFKPIRIKGAFWICSALLIGLFAVPYISGSEPVCLNGIYEMVCIALIFPVIVWIGASGTTTDRQSTGICRFLGDISYPVYIVHYPIMYLFYAWLIEEKLYTLTETWLVAIVVFAGNILLAYLCLKCYDEPVRKWLAKHLLKTQSK